MALVGAINILLGLEHSKFTTGTQKAAGSLKKFKAEADTLHSTMAKLNGVLGGFGLSLGISQTVSFLNQSVAAFEESHKSALKVKAVWDATGGVAGRTAEDVNKLADNLEQLTAVDDAVIRSGAAVLATFKTLEGDGFDRALKSAIDLSVVLETDVKSAAMQLGKALSDPVNGLDSLARAGVKFTDEQKNLIAALVESNQNLKAQDVILQEVESRFSGVAESMVTKIDRLSTAWGNLKESVGEGLLSVFLAPTSKELFEQTGQKSRIQSPFDIPRVRVTRSSPLPPPMSLAGLPTLQLPQGPMGPALPKSGFFGRSSADDFAASLIAGMEESLSIRQQRNLDAATAQRGFAGFASGAERGSADAFQQIAAFKFGNVGQDQKDRERAIKEAEKQNVKLEQIHGGIMDFIKKAEFQELKIDE